MLALLTFIWAFLPNFWPAAFLTWQVKSGTLFDNVVITDDPEYAKQLAEETWGKQKDVSCLYSPTL